MLITLLPTLALSLALTLILEGLFALLWGVRSRRDYLLLLAANAQTNPAVVLFHCLVSDSAAAVAVSEVLAVLAEAALYRRFGSEKLRPALLFSLCANVFSFCCGLLLNIVVFKLSTAPY